MQSQHVYIVDDDRDVRVSISFMLNAAKVQARPFASGHDLVESLEGLQAGIILLDIRMPEMDGFQVMEALAQAGVDWPVIVMTGHGEVSVAVRGMKLGAVDFLEKPFSEETLFGSIERAFLLLQERGEKAQRKRGALAKVALLSRREEEVLRGLLTGLPNKLLARQLDISLRTVEMHRSNMMTRLGAESLAEALLVAIEAGLEPLAPDFCEQLRA